MTISKANAVYDLLEKIGGAHPVMRQGFIYAHCQDRDGCEEWRFGGKLGFGGKYRSRTNSVDCYAEDETDKILCIIDILNQELDKIK
jgi:hypothetical protein